MPMQIEAFTSVRTFAASASSVVKPGSSSPASTTFSNAMLIRSAGRFFETASLRITTSAIFRAFALSYDRPVRCRTAVRCRSAVRFTALGTVPSGRSTARRTKSTTLSGISSSFGKHPMR